MSSVDYHDLLFQFFSAKSKSGEPINELEDEWMSNLMKSLNPSYSVTGEYAFVESFKHDDHFVVQVPSYNPAEVLRKYDQLYKYSEPTLKSRIIESNQKVGHPMLTPRLELKHFASVFHEYPKGIQTESKLNSHEIGENRQEFTVTSTANAILDVLGDSRPLVKEMISKDALTSPKIKHFETQKITHFETQVGKPFVVDIPFDSEILPKRTKINKEELFPRSCAKSSPNSTVAFDLPDAPVFSFDPIIESTEDTPMKRKARQTADLILPEFKF